MIRTNVRNSRLVTASLVAAIALLVVVPERASAQAYDTDTRGRKGGTYLKGGLAYWQGDIFSESPFTQWSVDLFGADYDLTSVNVGIDVYFSGAFLISGVSVAYRKDALSAQDSGHLLSGGVFRDVDLRVFALRAGGGVEWGVPSLNFDQTVFDTTDPTRLRYRHTYPDRNAYVPRVGTKSDGALYPFVEFAVMQRPGRLLIEGGMRVNLMRFHFDDYEVSATEGLRTAFTERRIAVPYLFANIGVKLF